MRSIFPVVAAAFLILASSAGAEPLAIPASPASVADVPARGMSMSAVTARYGEPTQRHAPVGGGHPKRPPITRWDYDGYSVFFENQTVIDVVVQGQMPPLQHMDELSPAP